MRRFESLLPALLLCLLALGSAPPWNESRIDAGQARLVYGTQQDEISLEDARALLLSLVNGERQSRRLGQLTLLPLAGRLAQEHAGEMAERRYFNHYSLAGLKCEARWNGLGGTDQVSENVTYYEIGCDVYLTPELVRKMHAEWMASKPHRENMLKPEHTGFGAGFGIVRQEGVTYAAGVEEFIAHYGEYSRLPEQAAPGLVLRLAGRLDPALAVLCYVTLGVEPLPFARDADYQMRHTGGYSPPAVFEAHLARQGVMKADLPGVPVRRDVSLSGEDGTFAVSLPLHEGTEPGAYYVTVWAASKADPARAFRAMTQVVLVK